MNKPALIIIFNHNYQQNLEKLDAIYHKRFTNIFYVIPFYQGDRNDVITVFESSYYFQNFIATAIDRLKPLDFEHLLFVADDLFINPIVNENNYQHYFNIDQNACFISNYFLLSDKTENRPSRPMAPLWNPIFHALNFNPHMHGFELCRYIPPFNQAVEKFKNHGLAFTKRIPKGMFFPKKYRKSSNWIVNAKEMNSFIGKQLKHLKYLFKPTALKYPLAGGYSDILILDKSSLTDFSTYAHAFGAANLFVEIAIPSALLLASKKISTENNITLKTETYWYYSKDKLKARVGNSLSALINNFPEDTLYIHPVKLSSLA